MRALLKSLRGGLTYANVVATGAIFIALGGGAYAVTALPSANTVVFACAKKKGGALRTVKKTTRCRRGERKISWNVGGQAGPGGSQGATGSPGRARRSRSAWWANPERLVLPGRQVQPGWPVQPGRPVRAPRRRKR